MDDFFSIVQDKETPDRPGRPDFAEKRLAMAMIRDAIGELDRWASGDRRRRYIMEEAILWVRGDAECRVTFGIVCTLLGWDESSVRKALLGRLNGDIPEIKAPIHVPSTRGRGRPKAVPASEGQPGHGADQLADSGGSFSGIGK